MCLSRSSTGKQLIYRKKFQVQEFPQKPSVEIKKCKIVKRERERHRERKSGGRKTETPFIAKFPLSLPTLAAQRILLLTLGP